MIITVDFPERLAELRQTKDSPKQPSPNASASTSHKSAAMNKAQHNPPSTSS